MQDAPNGQIRARRGLLSCEYLLITYVVDSNLFSGLGLSRSFPAAPARAFSQIELKMRLMELKMQAQPPESPLPLEPTEPSLFA